MTGLAIFFLVVWFLVLLDGAKTLVVKAVKPEWIEKIEDQEPFSTILKALPIDNSWPVAEVVFAVLGLLSVCVSLRGSGGDSSS